MHDDVVSKAEAASQLCNSILEELVKSCKDQTKTSERPDTSITNVRHDFISLATFLGKDCTSLSLAFKPPVTLKAVDNVLDSLIGYLGQFRFCMQSCTPHGTLAKELNWSAQEVLEATQRLLVGLVVAFQAKMSTESTKLRDLNLVYVGQVWETVERAKIVSQDELEASRKSWKGTLGLIDDCLEEVKEMMESQVMANSERELTDEGSGSESDFDFDEFRQNHPFNEVEKARLEKAYMILRLGRLLLQRLITLSGSSDNKTSFTPEKVLTSLNKLTGQLSSSGDDLAAGLEPPQHDIMNVTESYTQICNSISTDLEGVMQGGPSQEAEAKWQLMWRSQVKQTIAKLASIEM